MNLKKSLTMIYITLTMLFATSATYADPPRPTGNGGVICNPACDVFRPIGRNGGGGGSSCLTLACNSDGCVVISEQTFGAC